MYPNYGKLNPQHPENPGYPDSDKILRLCVSAVKITTNEKTSITQQPNDRELVVTNEKTSKTQQPNDRELVVTNEKTSITQQPNDRELVVTNEKTSITQQNTTIFESLRLRPEDRGKISTIHDNHNKTQQLVQSIIYNHSKPHPQTMKTTINNTKSHITDNQQNIFSSNEKVDNIPLKSARPNDYSVGQATKHNKLPAPHTFGGTTHQPVPTTTNKQLYIKQNAMQKHDRISKHKFLPFEFLLLNFATAVIFHIPQCSTKICCNGLNFVRLAIKRLEN